MKISIGTVTGGIVNFGGAICISPISISNTESGSGSNNTGQIVSTISIGLSGQGSRRRAKV